MLKLLQNSHLLAIVITSLLLSACGSGPDNAGSLAGQIAAPAAGQELPWPEDIVAPRSISDSSVELLGSEYTEVGGGAHSASTVCKLNNGSAPWAIYSMGGFNFATLDSVRIDFNKLAGEGTFLYIAAANYQTNRWQWFVTIDNGPYTFTPANAADYYSPLGNVHLALLRTGPATIDVQKLTFFRTNEGNVSAPENLISDEQLPEYIGLTWDAVAGVAGYNVYRSRFPNLSDVIKITDELLLVNEYDDTAPLNGIIYYYYVTAVAGAESPPSNVVDIFAPLIDMAAPQNPHVISSTVTSVTIGWDWNEGELGPAPVNGFNVYLKAEPNFNLDPLGLIEVKKTSSLARSATVFGLAEDSLYYYRICGVTFNSARGRMTDDLPALTGEIWDWTEVNVIGNGNVPIKALETGSQISAIYFSEPTQPGDPSGINFAQGTGSNWTVSSCGLDGGSESFSNYLDLDERGGNFLISAYDNIDLDLYASFGSPSAGWTKEFVADGTKVGQFDVPSAGNHGTCAITDDAYNILHKDYYANMTYIHSRPLAGGAWDRTDVRAFTENGFPVELEMKSIGSALNFLYFDYEVHELFYGTGLNPLAMDQITDNALTGSPNKGLGTDLYLLPSGWVTPCYDATNKDLYLLRQNGANWDSENLAVQAGSSSGYGNHARLTGYKTGLICVYLSNSNKWFASVYDGTDWYQQQMLLPFNPGTEADIAVINDVPYFLVENNDESKIYCITGNLPPIGNV